MTTVTVTRSRESARSDWTSDYALDGEPIEHAELVVRFKGRKWKWDRQNMVRMRLAKGGAVHVDHYQLLEEK